MKKNVFAEKNKKSLTLSKLGGLAEKAEVLKSDFAALLLSRLDFDIKIIEIPKIKEQEIPSFLKFKLRSLYPGNPEDTVFDFVCRRVNGKSLALVFVTHKQTLNAYMSIAAGKPVFLPYQILEYLIFKKRKINTLVIFLHRNYLEAVLRTTDADSGLQFYVAKRHKDLNLDLQHIPFKNKPRAAECLIVCPPLELKVLEQALLGKNDFDLIKESRLAIKPYEMVFRHFKPPRHGLFAPNKFKISIPLGTQIQIFCLLLLGAGFLIYNKNLNAQKDYYTYLKGTMSLYEEKQRTLSSDFRKIEDLKQKIAQLKQKTPVNIYLVISELYEILGADTRIKSLTIEGNKIIVTGVATKPLDIMENFNSSVFFTEMKLIQTDPLKDTDLENFRIIGNIKEKVFINAVE